MGRTSSRPEGRQGPSAVDIAGAVVWVIATAAIAAWLFLIAVWDGVEIFSAPDREQLRSAWYTAVGSGLSFAAGPFGIWWFVRHRGWLVASGIALVTPLIALAFLV